MDSESETWILVSIAFALSLLTHSLIRCFLSACVLVTTVAPVLYVIESFIRLSLPPSKIAWVPFVLVPGALYSLAVATVTGLPFLAWRRRRHKNGGGAA